MFVFRVYLDHHGGTGSWDELRDRTSHGSDEFVDLTFECFVHALFGFGLRDVDQLDVDVITFETADNGGIEIADIAKAISKDKKVCIGVVSHRSLQIESTDSIVQLIERALEHIEPERLVLSSDCGFGRQGMSRMHAFYKMVAIAQAANIVRKRLGFKETPVLAADQTLSLL